MPASTRRLATALALATLALPAAPSSASQEETIVMTAPYADDSQSTSCTATGVCHADAAADRTNGAMETTVAAKAVSIPGVSGSDAIATAGITARHEVTGPVEAIRYRIVLDVEPALLASAPDGAQVRLVTAANHSAGVPLAGAIQAFAPYTAGIIFHDGDQVFDIELEVRPEEGDLIPEGTVDVTVNQTAQVLPRPAGPAAVLSGAAQAGYTVERIEATLVR